MGPPSVRHCNLVDIIRLVASLFQQVRHIDDITILLQLVSSTLLHFCYIMTVSNLLEQPCNKSDNAIKLQVQVINSLFQTACTKRRNVETKRPKRNGRNHRNDRNDRNETTETKRPKRNNRNETTETKRPKRNNRNETTETKRPKRNDRNETAENINYRKNGKY